ncbi:MAG: AAA family ATPase [Muribaculaceae bacterium]|nr:AAA family ATPase [Muribaculaceae bacterium]
MSGSKQTFSKETEYFIQIVVLIAAGILTYLGKYIYPGILAEKLFLRIIVSGVILVVISLICLLYFAEFDNKKPIKTKDDNRDGTYMQELTTDKAIESAIIKPSEVYHDSYNLCREQTNLLLSYLDNLNNDKELKDYINSLDRLEFFDDKALFSKYDNRIVGLFLIDLISCFARMGHNFDKSLKEALYPSFFIHTLITQESDVQSRGIKNFYKNTIQVEKIFNLILGVSKLDEENKYNFNYVSIFEAFDKERVQPYKVLLYRYAAIIAKADGKIDKKEADYLAGMRAGMEGMSDLNIKEAEAAKEEEDDKIVISLTFEKITDNKPATKPFVTPAVKPVHRHKVEKLNNLIGLSSVKHEVDKLTNFIKIQRIREKENLKAMPISYHCVFTGNPGTGKTTVARILAETYKELGILSKGHLVETDRSGLVAEYVGQTAVKTNQIIDKAIGGVLFIDEAYSLAGKSDNDFGSEAISTLLKRMEDDRSRLVVILAGYGAEMKSFIDSNPGLQSRFNRYIHFDDYTPEELLEIFMLNVRKNDYELSPSGLETVSKKIEKDVREKDKNFGNARYVRNLFEKTLENQAFRLAAKEDHTIDTLKQLIAEDIPQ